MRTLEAPLSASLKYTQSATQWAANQQCRK